MNPPRDARAGQALIESCFVIVVVSLLFFGLLQLSQLYAARTVNTYAATAGARARMVGFNDFMVHKVVRVASIPNAGAMQTPEPAPWASPELWAEGRPGALWRMALRARGPRAPQAEVERSRIPLYLGTNWWNEAPAVLDYERWPDLRHRADEVFGDMVRVRTEQPFPLVHPFRALFYADDHVPLRSGSPAGNHAITRELHYPVYLQ